MPGRKIILSPIAFIGLKSCRGTASLMRAGGNLCGFWGGNLAGKDSLSSAAIAGKDDLGPPGDFAIKDG